MTRRAYTVVWSPELHTDIADAWLRAEPDVRRRLTRAADLADRMLAPHRNRWVAHYPEIRNLGCGHFRTLTPRSVSSTESAKAIAFSL